MTEVTDKSILQFHWKVSPYDYSKEKAESLREKISKKYEVPKRHVKVIPDFITVNADGSNIPTMGDVVANIQDPAFQLELFKEYISANEIKDYDFDIIKQIDAEINGYIDYDVFDKFRRYSIKWIKWDNFLSYGPDNYFDFTTLEGLVLLNGEPANQSGKTTFAVDLIHFLLFGKTNRYATLAKFFNKHLPEATEYVVEGCITIEGQDYIIKRVVSRPALKKRNAKSKVTQKVEYYRLVGDNMEELSEYVESQEGESTAQTNKAIKDAIGKESDFDLIISITGKNLDDLIEKKETERGRLLARWIGLLPLEEKDKLARDKYNSSIKPYLLSNQYDSETLKNECKSYETMIKSLNDQTKSLKDENKKIDDDVKALEKTKETLLLAKQNIDESLLKIDSTTLKASIDKVVEDGKRKGLELNAGKEELNQLGEIEFSVNVYDKKVEDKGKCETEIVRIRSEYTHITKKIEALTKGEYCPTCGKKLDNVDNSAKIAELKEENEKNVIAGRKLKEEKEKLEKEISEMKESREKFQKASELKVKLAALETQVEKLRGEYKEQNALYKEYLKNNEAIDKNNKIDIEVRNTESSLQNKRNNKDTNVRFINENDSKVDRYKEEIDTRKKIINKIKDEEKQVKNWKIYLDMVGKNGVSKMVLRKTLPVINAHLSKMLNDVCDFDIEVAITDSNDVVFYIIKDGIRSDLAGGSGFESTVAALALRIVLANISTIPRVNFVVMDEVLGRVAKENYENMHGLYNKILENYDFIIQISHLDEIKDWHSTILTIKKENNVSTINVSTNNIV